jgi:hypothetical protein
MPIDPKVDCYEILGVPANADDGAIRAAFAALVHEYDAGHFSGTPDDAQQKLAEITTACEILVDPARRRRHDLQRRIHALMVTADPGDPTPNMDAPRVAKDLIVTARPSRHSALLYALLAAGIALTAFSISQYRQPQPEPPATSAPAVRPVTPAAVDDGTAAAPSPLADMETPAPVAASPVAAAPAQETKPAPAKSVTAKSAPTNRQGNATAPAPSPASEACNDVQTALGLCKPRQP